MHNHKHEHCKHDEVKHCSHCDVVYCKSCSKEWIYQNWTVTSTGTGTWASGSMNGVQNLCQTNHK